MSEYILLVLHFFSVSTVLKAHPNHSSVKRAQSYVSCAVDG